MIAALTVAAVGSWLTVRESPSTAREQTVLLYYYDEDRDRATSGNIMCSHDGLVPVTRTIDVEDKARDEVIAETVRLLLQGRISMAEEDQGFVANFPIDGVVLNGVLFEGNESESLRLNFSDLFGKSSGGSCRVGILRAQITATAMQFDGIDAVIIEPEDIFQP